MLTKINKYIHIMKMNDKDMTEKLLKVALNTKQSIMKMSDTCMSVTVCNHICSPPVFSGTCVARPLAFCVVFCWSLFVSFLLAIVLSVLRFIDPDYQIDIFKLFFLVVGLQCDSWEVQWLIQKHRDIAFFTN